MNVSKAVNQFVFHIATAGAGAVASDALQNQNKTAHKMSGYSPNEYADCPVTSSLIERNVGSNVSTVASRGGT